MSQLLLDELFDDDEEEEAARGQQQEGEKRGATRDKCQFEHSARKLHLEGEGAKDLQHAGTGQQFFGQQQTALGAAISTPSLSESNASTSLLCKPAKNEHHHVPMGPAGVNRQQQLVGGGGLDDADVVGAVGDGNSGAGYSCTVYYDALEGQLLDRPSAKHSVAEQPLLLKQPEPGCFVLNPVFCHEEEEGMEQQGRPAGEIPKCTSRMAEEEMGLPFGRSGLAATSRRSLTRGRQQMAPKGGRKGGGQLPPHKKKRSSSSSAQKRQSASTHSQHFPHPQSASAGSNSDDGTGDTRNPLDRKRQRAAEMRLLGNAGNGGRRQGTSVAPMTGDGGAPIADGPVDAAFGMTALSGNGKRVQAKQNQMYLITTLLPGTSSSSSAHHHHHGHGHHQNGRNTGGGQTSSHCPQQHQIPVALINRMMPTELILRVFSYLDITSLCRCAQVCRSWNRLAMDGSNWMDVDLFLFQREVKTAVVESLARRCGNFLKVLSLKGCENVQDNAMRSFATKCPNISSLALTKCKLITDATCEYIGRYCHRIVIIDLENCTLITDVAMKFLGEGCKRLEELNISWCEQITDLGVAYIARSCANLRTLFCKGLDNLSSNCFASLDMAELRRLSLLSCANVTDETVADITKRCHRLEFFSLSNCREITDQSLIAIAQGCPRLKDIELAGCTNLTDSGFIQLSKNCHELERMDLEECLLITDTTLSNLNNGCPNLTSLSLSHCENLTDNGLAELCVAHKEWLQVLELDNCPNITDSSLESMKVLRALERVDLYDCQMITKDAIKKFKQVCPEVEVHAYFAPATPPPQEPPPRRGICRCCAIL